MSWCSASVDVIQEQKLYKELQLKCQQIDGSCLRHSACLGIDVGVWLFNNNKKRIHSYRYFYRTRSEIVTESLRDLTSHFHNIAQNSQTVRRECLGK